MFCEQLTGNCARTHLAAESSKGIPWSSPMVEHTARRGGGFLVARKSYVLSGLFLRTSSQSSSLFLGETLCVGQKVGPCKIPSSKMGGGSVVLYKVASAGEKVAHAEAQPTRAVRSQDSKKEPTWRG